MSTLLCELPMNITDMLAAPDGAMLASIAGEVVLVTVRHASEDEVRLKRFRLGAVVDIETVRDLLAAQGIGGGAPAAAVVQLPPVQERATPALPLDARREEPPAGAVACDLCPRTFKNQHGLDVHRSIKHRPPAAPAIDDVAVPPAAVVASASCPTCGVVLVEHDECDRCGMLIGTGHFTERPVFITGLNLCQDCARQHHTARTTPAEVTTPQPA